MADEPKFFDDASKQQGRCPPWYVKKSRDEAGKYVKQMNAQGLGNFCIRPGSSPGSYALTSCINEKINHYAIKSTKNGYKLDVVQDPPLMSCLYKIVEYYTSHCANSKPIALSARTSLPPTPSDNRNGGPQHTSHSTTTSPIQMYRNLTPLVIKEPIAQNSNLMSPVLPSPVTSSPFEKTCENYQNIPKPKSANSDAPLVMSHEYLKPDTIRKAVQDVERSRMQRSSSTKIQPSFVINEESNPTYIVMTRRGSHNNHEKTPYVNLT